MPKISLISPVYGVEKYIANFITSVIKQTFDDFELLLVNDGTKDDSIKIAEKLLKKSNVKYKIINKKNGGQSSARNVGIKNASGDFLAIVDSDDALNKNYLNDMYKVASKENCDVVICDLHRVIDDNIFEEANNVFSYDVSNGKTFFEDFFMHNIEIGPYSLLIKKEFLDKCGLLYNENSKYSEEFSFITYILHDANKVAHLKEKLYNYCLRKGSVSTSASTEKIINGFNEIKELGKKFEKCHCNSCKKYMEFAHARWILATARFSAKNLKYNDYKSMMYKLDYKNYINKLYKSPNKKIRLTSHVLNFSLCLSYFVFKKWRSY